MMLCCFQDLLLTYSCDCAIFNWDPSLWTSTLLLGWDYLKKTDVLTKDVVSVLKLFITWYYREKQYYGSPQINLSFQICVKYLEQIPHIKIADIPVFCLVFAPALHVYHVACAPVSCCCAILGRTSSGLYARNVHCSSPGQGGRGAATHGAVWSDRDAAFRRPRVTWAWSNACLGQSWFPGWPLQRLQCKSRCVLCIELVC